MLFSGSLNVVKIEIHTADLPNRLLSLLEHVQCEYEPEIYGGSGLALSLLPVASGKFLQLPPSKLQLKDYENICG
jgi:hypothetical protein